MVLGDRTEPLTRRQLEALAEWLRETSAPEGYDATDADGVRPIASAHAWVKLQLREAAAEQAAADSAGVEPGLGPLP